MSTGRDSVNILLVDDQPAKLLSLESILADMDVRIVKANSADEALKHLLSDDFAVVLMDVCMPKMDGFELAQLIREHPRFGRTAIIFISAVHFADEDLMRGYDLGAVDYIPVPIVPRVLRAKVTAFAELYRKGRQLERVNAELQDRLAELDRSNERLRFADRMAQIGTLAAGLGHDMGNLLLPVRMRLDALEAIKLGDEAKEDLSAIRKATEYLRRLATSLRMLALDPQRLATGDARTDVCDWWDEVQGMVRNAIPRTATLNAEIAEGLPPLLIDKAALTQITFNLVQNAGDALKTLPSGEVLVRVEQGPHGLVRLSVIDNGQGMSDDAKRRCLEPFFTTKTRELSTGLGLVLVTGLVKRAGGAIEIDTALGRGTRFSVDLPACECDRPKAPESAKRPVAAVSLRDTRLSAHVRTILDSMSYEVRLGEPADADVWVTEHAGDDPRVRAFLASGAARRAVVFGSGPAGATQNGHSSPQAGDDAPARIVVIDSAVKASILRTRFEEALARRVPHAMELI